MADSDAGYKVGPGPTAAAHPLQVRGCSALSPWSGSADAAPPPPEPRRLAAADKEAVQQFVARLRRQVLHEIGEARAADPPG